MTTLYEFIIDGFTIPSEEAPARGPIVDIEPRRWIKQHVLGSAVSIPTIMTLVGRRSQEWDFVSRATTATKDKYLEVHNGDVEVLLKTPQDSTGFNVLMERLFIRYITPIYNGLFHCEFTLVRR